MSNWKNPAPDASPVRSPTDSVTMQIGETGGTDELVEPVAWRFRVRMTDEPWSYQRERFFNEAYDFEPLAPLSALTSLRAERDRETEVAKYWREMSEIVIDKRQSAETSLAAEKLKVEELTSELAAMRASRDGLADEINAAQFKKDRDQQRVAALVGALKPFGADAKNWADTVPDDYAPRCTEPGKDYAHPGSEASFTVGDLRRAAALATEA